MLRWLSLPLLFHCMFIVYSGGCFIKSILLIMNRGSTSHLSKIVQSHWEGLDGFVQSLCPHIWSISWNNGAVLCLCKFLLSAVFRVLFSSVSDRKCLINVSKLSPYLYVGCLCEKHKTFLKELRSTRVYEVSISH